MTDVPGTTRDIIEDYINIKGVPLRIIDTAGIRETQDVVERIGVERSRQLMEQADLILFLLDISEELSHEDRMLMEMIKGKKAIILLNKTDLPSRVDQEDLVPIWKTEGSLRSQL